MKLLYNTSHLSKYSILMCQDPLVHVQPSINTAISSIAAASLAPASTIINVTELGPAEDLFAISGQVFIPGANPLSNNGCGMSVKLPSSKYHTTLFKVPHNPLQNIIPPSSKYHTTLFKVPHHSVVCRLNVSYLIDYHDFSFYD